MRVQINKKLLKIRQDKLKAVKCIIDLNKRGKVYTIFHLLFNPLNKNTSKKIKRVKLFKSKQNKRTKKSDKDTVYIAYLLNLVVNKERK